MMFQFFYFNILGALSPAHFIHQLSGAGAEVSGHSSVRESDVSKEMRCWDVALGPLKQIPMNLFIMYMYVITFCFCNIKFSLFHPAFKLLESSSQQWLQSLVYFVGNLLGLALAVYKCQSMGLLPTHSSDWLAFIEPPESTTAIWDYTWG
uniref:ER membrane protein complex subunit 4 n=1 Tax=Erpetoichthys calabaricus TaxID=27687 RepID=A0A8C4X4Z1_ERPCA